MLNVCNFQVEVVLTASAAVAMESSNSSCQVDGLSRQESLDFELLYLIEREPGLSQREIADRLGISLGRANYCLKALMVKGAVKLANFRASKTKLRYVYVLTPSGLSRRVSLTRDFLARKLAEYERLEEQIEGLRRELGEEPGRA